MESRLVKPESATMFRALRGFHKKKTRSEFPVAAKSNQMPAPSQSEKLANRARKIGEQNMPSKRLRKIEPTQLSSLRSIDS
jgi:hypothetical protein